TPPDARRLSAVDELALSASLRDLPVGERGWITLSEARALFSPMDDRYAFGEMDEVGKMSLAAFAAESDHRSAFDLMPVEGRGYFTRKTPLSFNVSAIRCPLSSANASRSCIQRVRMCSRMILPRPTFFRWTPLQCPSGKRPDKARSCQANRRLEIRSPASPAARAPRAAIQRLPRRAAS